MGEGSGRVDEEGARQDVTQPHTQPGVPWSGLDDTAMQHKLHGRCLSPGGKGTIICILSPEVTGYSPKKVTHSSDPFSGK